jgi:hypothetical protein
MIPALHRIKPSSPSRIATIFLCIFFNQLSTAADAPAAGGPDPVGRLPVGRPPASCLPSGDGYLRTHLTGSIEAVIDWPNSGTRCEGEERPAHQGMSLSFRRDPGAGLPGTAPDLLFVFGISKAREGETAHGLGVNLTVFLQGTAQVYGTLGESRCTVDSLTQTRIAPDNRADGTPGSRRYRVEARGFCTQPAHAVRGDGAVLLTTFDFAGSVSFDLPEHAADHTT